MVRGLIALLLLALTPGSGLDAAPESRQGIPAEVVAMLAPMAGPSAPGAGGELRAGGPPAGFPAGIFPPDSTFNATLEVPARNFTVVVATALKLSAAEFEKYEAGLIDSGWVSTSPRLRGFTMGAPSGQYPINVCRGNDFISLTSQSRAAGGLYLRATLTRDPRRSCFAPAGSSTMADIDMPRLSPPAGARQVGGGGGGGGLDALYSTARIETTMAPRAVAEHYEKLLVGAGWKVVARLRDGDELALVRLEVPSRMGVPLSAWLSATKLGDTGDQDVFLRVLRNTRDPRASFIPSTSSTVMPLGGGR